ncbi:insulin-like growth factor-binding protein complex acid labile subunit [Mytilus edulis]|uniref:insulin-like growth factor-binding protein complex acid labile subunit n=1 Tax=Mytilus edulis TaxID=6550 RepID=UPI0039EFA480
MMFTVEFMLMFSLSTIHLARAQGCPNMCTCSGPTVYCFNKGLTQIPDDIPATTRTLYLHLNSITSIEENGFKGLTSLQTLYLSGNGITSIEPNVFEGLTSLQFLYLNDNSITSIEENGFEGLTSLQELSLSGNSITSIEENVFEGLTSIQKLYLSGNGITSIEPNVFEGLTSLQLLYLYDNSITSIEENGFEGLTSLQELSLSGNSITSIEENVFEGLTSIQKLYFNNNPLVCCSVTGFVDWVNRRSWGLFEGTCTAHNKTTAILNFNTSDCIVPVDGGWSDWENSTCSVTCGDGTVTMNRECNNPVPSGGGNNCSGKSINTDSCYLRECPVDGGWSDWENSTCSVTCGDGTVNMNRECINPVPSGGGHNCSGESFDTDSCNLGVCPESCSTLEKELDKKSGKRSDNKSGKWSDNKSGKWSVNKSGGKRNGRNGKKEKRQNKKGNKPNRNGWY